MRPASRQTVNRGNIHPQRERGGKLGERSEKPVLFFRRLFFLFFSWDLFFARYDQPTAVGHQRKGDSAAHRRASDEPSSKVFFFKLFIRATRKGHPVGRLQNCVTRGGGLLRNTKQKTENQNKGKVNSSTPSKRERVREKGKIVNHKGLFFLMCACV